MAIYLNAVVSIAGYILDFLQNHVLMALPDWKTKQYIWIAITVKTECLIAWIVVMAKSTNKNQYHHTPQFVNNLYFFIWGFVSGIFHKLRLQSKL
jgi:hypothetical protein